MRADKTRGFEVVSDKHREFPNTEIKIPIKATPGSAGYDFYCPVDVDIPPQTSVSFRTDIKVYMQPGEVLLLFSRSSTGIKHNLELANSVVVGDADFYENEANDGNYSIVLFNRSPAWEYVGDNSVEVMGACGLPIEVTIPVVADTMEENTVRIKSGDRLVQGLFVQTLPADNDAETLRATRTGGIGSTNE